jgi:hypothetical protein
LPPDGLGVHGTTAPAAENAANHTRYWRSTPFQTSASLRTVDINGWSTTRRLAMRPIHSRADTTRRGAKVVRPGPGQDRRTRGASALLISAALAAAVTGCGNDEDDTAAACDAWVDVERAFNIDEDLAGGITALDTFVDAVPSDVSDDIEPLIAMLRENPEAAFESAEIITAESAGDDYAVENCGDTVVEVEAVNFAYTGIPETIESGRVVFNLTNNSQTGEFHEALLLRTNDDTTTSAHDVLAAGLTEPVTAANTFEALAPFTLVATSLVEPAGGDTDDVFLADLDPGNYILACLLPVDSPDLLEAYFNGEEVDAQRHFSEGMFAEFTVS